MRDSDPTRDHRAVHSHFRDGGAGERARFTGDLAKEPSFDLWERRYRLLAANLDLPELDKVMYLSQALSNPALTFFTTRFSQIQHDRVTQ